MNGFFEGRMGSYLRSGLVLLAWFLCAFVVVEIIGAVMGWRYIGAGIAAANTITVSGEGVAYAVPDTGEFTYSVTSEKSTVAAAQDDATAKANAVTDYLKSAGVDEKDIQTTDYSVSPRYEYSNGACPAGGYCPPGKQTLVGYDVTQTNTVKVRDTSKAGDLLAGVGGKGATNVSGLSFTVDDPTAVETEARDKAIADAKGKADKLAQELGVSLVRVTGFQENQGGQPMPIYSMAAGSAPETKAAVAPQVSVGQNKMTDNVTVTYEIR